MREMFENCDNLIFIGNTRKAPDGEIYKLPDIVKVDGEEIELNSVLIEAYLILVEYSLQKQV